MNKKVLLLIIIALIFKLSLFLFAALNSPQAKLMPDSGRYLDLADTLVSKGVFAIQDQKGNLVYEVFRTPGYPLFLAITHYTLKVPLDGVILTQIILTLLTAFVTYKTALKIDPKIALIAVLIILFDPPISIYSLMILTETLFMLILSLFMWSFTLYLNGKKTIFLVLSALALAAAVYVRPIAYYLGGAVFLFIIYANRRGELKKNAIHAFIFISILCSLLGVWQARNYVRCGTVAFSSIESHNLSAFGLAHSYAGNTDPCTRNMKPAPYYINVSARCLMSLMTRQGNFKYFQRGPLTAVGNAIAYIFMLFWLTGFIFGAISIKKSIYLQFIMICVLYFIVASIGGVMWLVGDRFRVPMMPFIAVIAAHGLVKLMLPYTHILSAYRQYSHRWFQKS